LRTCAYICAKMILKEYKIFNQVEYFLYWRNFALLKLHNYLYLGAVGCGPQEEFRSCADITIGDNETIVLPKLPKQPITTPVSISTDISPTDTSSLPKSIGPYWLFSVVIAGTCLLVVLAAMALLYTYYYHAGKAKKWLMARRFLVEENPPVAPPRHKKHHHISQLQL